MPTLNFDKEVEDADIHSDSSDSDEASPLIGIAEARPTSGETTRVDRTSSPSSDSAKKSPRLSGAAQQSRRVPAASPKRQHCTQPVPVNSRSRQGLESDDSFDQSLPKPRQSRFVEHVDCPQGCNGVVEDFGRQDTDKAYAQHIPLKGLPPQGADRRRADTRRYLPEGRYTTAEIRQMIQARNTGALGYNGDNGRGRHERGGSRRRPMFEDDEYLKGKRGRLEDIILENNMRHTFELHRDGLGWFGFTRDVLTTD